MAHHRLVCGFLFGAGRLTSRRCPPNQWNEILGVVMTRCLRQPGCGVRQGFMTGRSRSPRTPHPRRCRRRPGSPSRAPDRPPRRRPGTLPAGGCYRAPAGCGMTQAGPTQRLQPLWPLQQPPDEQWRRQHCCPGPVAHPDGTPDVQGPCGWHLWPRCRCVGSCWPGQSTQSPGAASESGARR